ncbi:MAG: hypothetical protein H8D67_30990 [Deltaproteobacteria bacterium]|nr:hypothetical protein [Deltaproteobacteria bacterium]
MDNEQFERLIRILYCVEESIKKSKTTLSWLPFWWIGYLFTIGYNWVEVGEILTEHPWYENLFYIIIWFMGWPWCLGYTLNR